MKQVIVSGGYDGIGSKEIRFLDEASTFGPLTVMLWNDDVYRTINGKAPKFPYAERLYFLNSIRYVDHVVEIKAPYDENTLRGISEQSDEQIWLIGDLDENGFMHDYAMSHNIPCKVIYDLAGFKTLPEQSNTPGRKKVIVTGCYDWFHTGHVRFFEEASEYGDLYVVVGHDANIRLLKGEGHPMFLEDERRYIVQSIKFVHQALISTGNGWMDAEPEIDRIKPDIYVVNEDGDKPEKREFCKTHGLEYKVLKRLPKEGLTRRASTDLRGF